MSIRSNQVCFCVRREQDQKGRETSATKPVKRFEKYVKAESWMSRHFPLTLAYLDPVLEVLAMQDELIQRFRELLETEGLREAGFPVHVTLPLYLGVYGTVQFQKCVEFSSSSLPGAKVPPGSGDNSSSADLYYDEDLFNIPLDYEASRKMEKALGKERCDGLLGR